MLGSIVNTNLNYCRYLDFYLSSSWKVVFARFFFLFFPYAIESNKNSKEYPEPAPPPVRRLVITKLATCDGFWICSGIRFFFYFLYNINTACISWRCSFVYRSNTGISFEYGSNDITKFFKNQNSYFGIASPIFNYTHIKCVVRTP